MYQFRHHKHFELYTVLTLTIIIALGYGVYVLITTKTDLRQTKTKLASSIERVDALEKQNLELGGTLSETQGKNQELDSELAQQREENKDLEEEKEMYQKLAKTDKQLLAKYSKVYFLNENYSPTKLADIDKKYVVPAGKKLQFLDPALPYLEDLLENAEEDGVALRIVSAFRSFQEQKSLKSNYTMTYGIGTANSFSAEQGFSEHQLGTTVDFTTPALVSATQAFVNTSAHTWLIENAFKYGFILSYPKSNSYYIYEPWHWRFVGVDLARDLHKKEKNFYDMDQRDIDDYLIEIFD